MGSQVVITGSYFTGATDVKFGNASSPEFTVDSESQITAIVPNSPTSGKIQVTTPSGTGTSASAFTIAATPLPKPPTCENAVCSLLGLSQGTVINSISNTVATALPSSGPALKCSSDGCPIPSGQTAPSVANTIGMYGYNIVYGLAGGDDVDPRKWGNRLPNCSINRICFPSFPRR